jgi:hypothetical protein
MRKRGKNLPPSDVVGQIIQCKSLKKCQWKSEAKNPPIFLKKLRGG